MKILIPHTRELCYYSGVFFLDRIQTELENNGCDVIRLELVEDDFSDLEQFQGASFDAIIDINSRLPKLIDDKGRYFIDEIDAPFFNYIVDHPLYHHPGLSVKLKNYHAIAVDKKHREFISANYPHIKDVHCIPMGGTKAFSEIPFDERKYDLLFSGTYLSDEVLEERSFRVRSDHGDATYQLIEDLYEAWDPFRGTIEDALHKLLFDQTGVSAGDVKNVVNDVYEAADEAELLNRLYIVDQMKRNEWRLKTLLEAAKTGYNLYVLGEGWDMTGLSGIKNVKLLKPVPMELSFEVMVNSKCVIDINPFFYCGMHDRVTSSLANGCISITDMSPAFDPKLSEDGALLYYGGKNPALSEAMDMVMKNGKGTFSNAAFSDIIKVAAAGYEAWKDRYGWDAHVKKLLEVIRGLDIGG